jgi:hypothetical protein
MENQKFEMLKNFEDYIKLLEELRLPGMDNQIVRSWINTKVDNDLDLRISRYTKAIDPLISKSDIDNIGIKLDLLDSFSNKRGLVDYGIQSKIALLILLQYLKEIKINFDGSSSGFLFENYIAGLVHKSKTPGNKIDDLTLNDYKFQIKLNLFSASEIKISDLKTSTNVLNSGEDTCHYYIIGLKDYDRVLIWILADDVTDFNNKSPFVHKNYGIKQYLKLPNSDEIDYSKINKIIDTSKLKNTISRKNYSKKRGLGKIERGLGAPYIIDFTHIDEIFTNITSDINENIKNIFDSLSELHYNIETIMTGINKISKKENDVEYTFKQIKKNTNSILSNLTKIKDDFTE